jgi:hypothetical protein
MHILRGEKEAGGIKVTFCNFFAARMIRRGERMDGEGKGKGRIFLHGCLKRFNIFR